MNYTTDRFGRPCGLFRHAIVRMKGGHGTVETEAKAQKTATVPCSAHSLVLFNATAAPNGGMLR